MHYVKYLISLVVITFLVTSIDQMWKYIMINVLIYGYSFPVIKGFLSFTLVFNTGAAFGIFPDKQYLFLILPVVAIILILVLYIKSAKKEPLVIPMALLLGGTVGNFIDRLRFGYVIDFFDFYWNTYHWPAFNFADTSICLGVVLLICRMLQKQEVGR